MTPRERRLVRVLVDHFDRDWMPGRVEAALRELRTITEPRRRVVFRIRRKQRPCGDRRNA
jgi:hypothetical protein